LIGSVSFTTSQFPNGGSFSTAWIRLSGAGYHVLQAGDGVQGWETAEREQPSLVLLDVDMPQADGWQTLERLQQGGFRHPIIMLTGSTQIDERVRGLSGGADDYLCKPCDLRELLARVHAALRRCQPAVPVPTRLHFGGLTVDLADRTAFRAGAAISLTRTEYTMLELFARHPGRRVTRAQMLDEVWGYGEQSHTRTVETHIWRLRQKLGDHPGEPRWIQTVAAGGGYRMVSDEVVAA
jgi:DNA-binding response OmpR family regulator